MKTTKSRLLSIGLFGFGLTLSQAHATTLPILGGSVSPATLTLGSGSGFAGSPIISVNDLANWKNGGTTEGAVNLVQGVWVDPSSQDLDFFYQLQNNSPAATGSTGSASTIGNQGASSSLTQTTVVFTGFGPALSENVFDITSAQFSATALGGSLFVKPTSGEAVTTVSNATTGNLVVTLNQNLAPGTNSAILVVETNAKTFDNGGQALLHWKQNPALHGATSGTAYSSENINLGVLEPTPEPGVYGLLSLAVAGLFLVMHRRSEKAKAKTAQVVA